MKIISKICAVVVAIAALVACNMIKDDLKDCPQDLTFRFYSQSSCDAQRSYPQSVQEIMVFVFDQNNILADVQQFECQLSESFEKRIEFRKEGAYSFVAWASEKFSQSGTNSYSVDYQIGSSSKQQLLLALQHQAGEVAYRPSYLFFGEGKDISNQSSVINRVVAPFQGTEHHTVEFNLQEISNRLNFRIHGLPSGIEYDVFITDNNDKYDFNSNIVSSTTDFRYTTNVVAGSVYYSANFVELKLEEGRNARLVVWDKTNDKEAFSCNIIEDLILNESEVETPFDLACDHDFDIELTVEYSVDTWKMLFLVINDWNLVTREVAL